MVRIVHFSSLDVPVILKSHKRLQKLFEPAIKPTKILAN